MRTDLRLASDALISIVESSEGGAIEAIYSYLMGKYQQDIYKRIVVIQIDTPTNELVLIEKDMEAHVKILYKAPEGFNSFSVEDKNKVRVDCIHAALLKVFQKDRKFNKGKLETIKEEILMKNFFFEIICKKFWNKNKTLLGKLILSPFSDRFEYYVTVTNINNLIKCKIKIYNGKPDIYYFGRLFSFCKWTKNSKIIINGNNKEVEIHIDVNRCMVKYINFTPYPNPPFFQMMRADISKEESNAAYNDYLNSLPRQVHDIVISRFPPSLL
jgi:hypothetical protein